MDGADYETNAVTANPVSVIVTDDDTRGVTVSPTTLSVPEFKPGQEVEANEREYTVVLESQPTANVTITIEKTGETTLTADESSLTFTAINWETAQTVTVSAADDNDHANEQAVFAHAASGGDYTTIPVIMVASVTATTVDTDAANVIISKASLAFEEGATRTYTIVLTTDPETATVTVGISVINGSGDNESDVAISTQMITFTGTVGLTPGNWNTAQTITVTSPADVDAADEMATIDHTVSSNYGDGRKPADITVSVNDSAGAGRYSNERPFNHY